MAWHISGHAVLYAVWLYDVLHQGGYDNPVDGNQENCKVVSVAFTYVGFIHIYLETVGQVPDRLYCQGGRNAANAHAGMVSGLYYDL